MTRITNAMRDAIAEKAIEKAGLNDKRADYDKRRAAMIIQRHDAIIRHHFRPKSNKTIFDEGTLFPYD
ncbi:MAG: hypothetical protein GY701_33525 [Sulfitobacter sp.]|nr:hypothetical protein [Sulfitobacter sp.]